MPLTTELDYFERRVLKTLSHGGKVDVERLADGSGLNVDQVRKAVQGLKDRGLASIQMITRKVLIPGEKAGIIAERGLPERILAESLVSLGGASELRDLRRSVDLDEGDFSAGLGRALENEWIRIERGDGERIVRVTDKVGGRSGEEILLEALWRRGEIWEEELDEVSREALKKLLGRPSLVKLKATTEELVELTGRGRLEAETITVEEEFIGPLTSELIRTGRWRGARFKSYDLNAPTAPLHPGRRHPLNEIIEEIREIFISLGFQEASGPLIELAFWNFDCLFQPQDHPARDMQDTFYFEGLEGYEIPERELIEPVRRTHEDGWITGSTGWGGRWSLEEARRLVLRTHTTVGTVRKVYEVGERPQKTFIVGRVFRNEKVTFKNTAEFHQVDGIVVDEKANLRQLMGVLKEFYGKLGLKMVKFWPSYFPYTEPSVQTTVYVERLDRWVELCGMGIFRPEVTIPLGVRMPVLAWGGGIERIAMLRYDLEDIRDLYRNDIGWLRRRPIRRLSI
jgi:phenylalanyl-tRNA synthetase alpha chain